MFLLPLFDLVAQNFFLLFFKCLFVLFNFPDTIMLKLNQIKFSVLHIFIMFLKLYYLLFQPTVIFRANLLQITYIFLFNINFILTITIKMTSPNQSQPLNVVCQVKGLIVLSKANLIKLNIQEDYQAYFLQYFPPKQSRQVLVLVTVGIQKIYVRLQSKVRILVPNKSKSFILCEIDEGKWLNSIIIKKIQKEKEGKLTDYVYCISEPNSYINVTNFINYINHEKDLKKIKQKIKVKKQSEGITFETKQPSPFCLKQKNSKRQIKKLYQAELGTIIHYGIELLVYKIKTNNQIVKMNSVDQQLLVFIKEWIQHLYKIIQSQFKDNLQKRIKQKQLNTSPWQLFEKECFDKLSNPLFRIIKELHFEKIWRICQKQKLQVQDFMMEVNLNIFGFNGRIDMIIKDKQQKKYALDFKTGSFRQSDVHQIALYTFLLFVLQNQDEAYGFLYYTGKDSFGLKKYDLKPQMIRSLLRIRNKINKEIIEQKFSTEQQKSYLTNKKYDNQVRQFDLINNDKKKDQSQQNQAIKLQKELQKLSLNETKQEKQENICSLEKNQ